jgi:hypothetical protein
MSNLLKKINLRSRRKVLIAAGGVLLAVGLALFLIFHGPSFSNSAFSVRAPYGWSKDSLEGSDLKKLMVMRFRHKDPSATFHITASTVSGQADFSTLPAKLKTEFEKAVKGFKEIGSSSTTVDGNVALLYEYSFNDLNVSGKTYTTHQEMLIVQSGDKVFYLIGQAQDGNYAAVREDIAKIFDSFNLK